MLYGPDRHKTVEQAEFQFYSDIIIRDRVQTLYPIVRVLSVKTQTLFSLQNAAGFGARWPTLP